MKKEAKPLNIDLLRYLLYDEDFFDNMQQVYLHTRDIQVRFLKQNVLDFYFGFWKGNDVWIVRYEYPIEGSVWVGPTVPNTPATLATTTSDEWSENEDTMKFLKKLKPIATYKIPHS